MEYSYEKYDEDHKIQYCPQTDFDGSVTGHIVINVKAWFDEHPEERKRLGWIKHIFHSTKDIEYNHQTQYLTKSQKEIDPYTVEDVYHVMDKSEEMMLLEEMLEVIDPGLCTETGTAIDHFRFF